MTQTPQQIAANVTQKLKKKKLPTEPSAEDLKSQEFNAVWKVISMWDIGKPGIGFESATGTDVMSILNALRKGNTDAKQIASKQDYEINYVSYSYSIPKTVILAVMKEVQTTSRKRVYAVLREMGYVINTKTRKK